VGKRADNPGHPR